MLRISPTLSIPAGEIELIAIRSQGAGGQNVNKVASALHLRFDIRASSLPTEIKERLLARRDRRITDEGVIVIKAQKHRTREKNRDEAFERLADLIRSALTVRRPRKATRPTKASRERRLESKRRDARNKTLRGKVAID